MIQITSKFLITKYNKLYDKIMHKYPIGTKVLRTNCYGITNTYIIIELIYNKPLDTEYYTIAKPLKSNKLPKRAFDTLVREEDLSL